MENNKFPGRAWENKSATKEFSRFGRCCFEIKWPGRDHSVCRAAAMTRGGWRARSEGGGGTLGWGEPR